MCAPAAIGEVMMYCALPAMTSVSAGAAPLYGTWTTLMSASRFRISPA
jgi:hypothetical protein